MSNFTTKSTKKITLPNGESLEIRKKLSYGESIELDEAQSTLSPKDLSIMLFNLCITNWDLKDDENKSVELNDENLLLLDPDVALIILEEINKTFEVNDKKKDPTKPENSQKQ